MISNQDIQAKKVQPLLHEEKIRPPIIQIKPKIDIRNCSKNYSCVIYCPKNAISINPKGFPVINYDLCDGCLICLRECPSSGIKEEKE